ncbi:hypothetical protein BDA99DRAFT_71902 [Phascolomyces articulosus]|uniref:Calponin-homology (CH) domain-containing protein n=1 Tax=Phascolomyces articulosus TaxID=60185 RepID=A0AAD5PDG7_9FUNG|nr:hypothetical protein BDA99DRAFT_71902 [Phascolomyces articulosus]
MMPSKADAEAYVDWINSFEHISHQCSQITDLSDGIILFEVLADIDPKWFKLIRSADVGDNWVLKINNLKKLHKLVSRYYEEVLDRDSDNLPSINLNAIAKDADMKETIKLCQLVICIAVMCNKNQIYIAKIQHLSQTAQHALMLSIEDVMKTISGANTDQDPSPMGAPGGFGGTPMGGATTSAATTTGGGRSRPTSSYGEDVMFRNPAELTRIIEEKQDLEMQHKHLIEEHAQLRYRYDELESEKEDLQLRLRDMDKAVEQANETGRADFVMRTEIEHLKQDL